MYKLLSLLLLFPAVPAPAPDATVEKGIKFLLGDQQSDGSWKGWGNDIQHPQAELTATALCAMALMAHPEVEAEKSKEAVKKALAFVEAFKQKKKWTVWGEPYSVMFLSKLYAQNKDAALLKTIEKFVEVIELNQMKASGAWGYWGAPSGAKDHAKTFNTALCLMALTAAREAGVKTSDEKYSKGLEALKKFRNDDGTYNYHFWSKDKTNAQQAGYKFDGTEALSRSVMAELTLTLAKQGSQEALNSIVEKFFEKRDNLENVFKKRDRKEMHLKPNGTASYYYYYGHYHAGEALRHCSSEVQKKYRPVLRDVIVKTQESDGGWFDHRILGGPYTSTALALLTLSSAKD